MHNCTMSASASHTHTPPCPFIPAHPSWSFHLGHPNQMGMYLASSNFRGTYLRLLQFNCQQTVLWPHWRVVQIVCDPDCSFEVFVVIKEPDPVELGLNLKCFSSFVALIWGTTWQEGVGRRLAQNYAQEDKQANKQTRRTDKQRNEQSEEQTNH